MFIVRQHHIDAFRPTAVERFVELMRTHCRRSSMKGRVRHLSEEELKEAIRSSIGEARAHGFTQRGPVRLFMELSICLGSRFPADPQHPDLGALLRNEGGLAQKRVADLLCAQAQIFFEAVPELDREKAALVEAAAEAIEEELGAQDPGGGALDPPPELEAYTASMLDRLAHRSPEKLRQVGRRSASALLREAFGAAHSRNLLRPGEAEAIGALFFALGVGCAEDPFLPWVGRALERMARSEERGRGRWLAEEARAWLGAGSGKERGDG